jgi:hypothetical protein
MVEAPCMPDANTHLTTTIGVVRCIKHRLKRLRSVLSSYCILHLKGMDDTHLMERA